MNYIVADFVSRLNIASKGRFRSINVRLTKLTLDILDILYRNGIILKFRIISKLNCIRVSLKYCKNAPVFFNMKIISKPGCRKFISLNRLSLLYNGHAFGGFFIISTSKGLLTSNDCLFSRRVSGELLLKISV
jgi:ribosomal protein S8